MNLFKHKDKIYAQIQSGNWFGLQAIEVKEAQNPIHRHTGPKITMDQVDELKSFFEWSLEETKAETVVHGFVHDDHGWAFLVLPQEGYRGMSVKILEDHPNKVPTIARLPGTWQPGTPWEEKYNKTWSLAATWHHHCEMGAFQSGGDHKDELTKDGLHVTMGDIGKAKYSYHARASWRGVITDVRLSDWFEFDTRARDLPPEMQGEVNERLLAMRLTEQPAVKSFPEWWKENVIKKVYQSMVWTGHGTQHHSGGRESSGNQAWQKYNYGRNWQEERFARAIEEDLEKKGFTVEVINSMLYQLSEGGYDDLLKAMIKADCELPEALKVVEDLLMEQEAMEDKEMDALALVDSKDVELLDDDTPLSDQLYQGGP